MPQPSKDLDPTRSPQDWFGAHLRHWRMVRRKTQRELAFEVHVSASTIAKIEKAERPCDLPLARSLDNALDTGGILAWLCLRTGADADKASGDVDNPAVAPVLPGLPGFPGAMLPGTESTTDDGSHVDRRTFLGATGAAALLAGTPLSHLIKPAEPSRLPSVVRPEDIEQVEAAATVLAGWDHHYGGGGIVRTAAEAQLRWASALLELPCPDPLRAGLFAAAARLGMVVGAADFDAHAHQDARRVFAFAAACAEEAGQWHLRAKVYSYRARQAVWLGDCDSGLTYAELGLAHESRLTPTERAMLHTAKARALAKAGELQAALRAVGQADEAFAQARPGEDPPWMAYYDAAQHAGDTGHALYDLIAVGHRPDTAADRLRTAVEGHTEAYVRSRTFSRSKLASLTMATGDPHEAATIGNQALDEVVKLQSRRATDDMRHLARLAAVHRTTPEAAMLRDRIKETIKT
ncbi:helix-turn-helix domain-containing protein [Streptomyces sp. ISL-86]|uniref:helix-turn-helix domain-containing protein n=1 Tax=Streptomyces sp. ISL-86 TaxID=2819187 RepID=UPI001BEC23BF|nr:helix-turn-helix transcriptional regulator [Streptomyces sp. ISL-86]MBT2456806.1 helix-turn-helix transcriptional regulator [Streptomyces sp. ISL-86]